MARMAREEDAGCGRSGEDQLQQSRRQRMRHGEGDEDGRRESRLFPKDELRRRGWRRNGRPFVCMLLQLPDCMDECQILMMGWFLG